VLQRYLDVVCRVAQHGRDLAEVGCDGGDAEVVVVKQLLDGHPLAANLGIFERQVRGKHPELDPVELEVL
jgi:hypothetical protein